MENKNYNEMREKLILGLDVEDSALAYDLIEKLAPHVKFYKVGLQLITREGPKIIMTLRRKGLKIFYDAKFYDIPQTVFNSCYEAARLGVNMVNVHALGGPKMIQYAKDGLEKASDKLQIHKPLLLAVTILTSYENKDLKKYMKINLPIKDMVLHLADMAKKAGADGIVCSPEETRIIKKEFGKDFVVVTPGIRMGKVNKDDQKRIKTPYEAIKDGSDYIVVARPILQSEDKQATIMEIINQIQEGYKHARKNN